MKNRNWLLNLQFGQHLALSYSIVLIKNGHKVDQFNKFLDLNQFKTLFDYYFSALKSKEVKEHAR
jgi:hypothetical protein